MKYVNATTIRFSLTGLFALFALLGACYIYGYSAERITSETISRQIMALGHWGPVWFVLLNVIRPFFLFPAVVLAIAGGIAFGPLWGTIYLVIGTVLGAVLCYSFARRLGLDKFYRLCAKWLPLEKFAEPGKNTFKTLLLLRLAPILPWDAVSFLAGLSKVPFWPYILATLIGSIPGAIVFNYVGDAISQSFAKAALITAAAIAVIGICQSCAKRLYANPKLNSMQRPKGAAKFNVDKLNNSLKQ